MPVEESGIFFIPWGPGQNRLGVRQALGYVRSLAGREQLVTWARGIPHISLRCDVAR